ncbi:MAG: hypothetical protein GY810_18685 [Aureispira sp.]|nr:hypothetical protein [Aureispira sp.]
MNTFRHLLCYFVMLCLIGNLQAQDQPEITVTSGHINNIMHISFSDDGQFIATGSMDKTVRIWSRALRQEFRVLHGHSSTVWKVRYTSDGKHIISLDDKGMVIFWDHSTGQIVQRVLVDKETRDFAYIPNSNRILVKINNQIAEVDLKKGEKIASYGAVTGQITLAPDAKHMLYSSPEDTKQLVVADIKTGKEIHRLNMGGIANSITVSPDNKKVAVYNSKLEIVTWDLKTGKMISKVAIPAMKPIKDLEFTPNGKQILAMTMMAEILEYDIKTGKELRSMNYSDPSQIVTGIYSIGSGWEMAMSPDGKTLALSVSLSISKAKGTKPESFVGGILYDYKHGRELGRLQGYFKMVTQLAVNSNGRYLMSASVDKYPGLRIWNMKEGDLQRYIPTSGIAGISADGKFFSVWEDAPDNGIPTLKVYNSSNLEEVFTVDNLPEVQGIALNADGSVLMVMCIEKNPTQMFGDKFLYKVWDVKNKKELNSFYIDATESPWGKSLKLSPDGKYIIGQSFNGFRTWSVEKGQVSAFLPPKRGEEYFLDFVPNSNSILIARRGSKYGELPKINWVKWDYIQNKVIESKPSGEHGVCHAGHFSKDGQYLVTSQTQAGAHFDTTTFQIVVWDWETQKPICKLNGHHGDIKHVKFGPKNKRIYSAAEDGFIKIWDWKKCELMGSMIAKKEIDYIIITPDNFYKASKGHNEGLGFRYQNKLYTFDQFDVRFNRPDKVLAHLGASKYSLKLYVKAWEKRLKRLGFTPESLKSPLELPTLEILNQQELPIATTNRELKLNLKAVDEKHYLDRINVYINDVPVPKLQGISVKKQQKHSIEQELKINLSQGDNLVKISVLNDKGLESARETFQITYNAKKQKPELYVLAISVSEFKEKERNLKFAVKDAKDLIGQFDKSNYYKKVHSHTIFNKDATKTNALNAIDFLKTAKVDDQVLIYISSHGLLNDDLDYYIAMHDIDFTNPTEKGLPYEQIDAMLDGLACRNRLIMIDACHSGEVDKDEAVDVGIVSAENSNVRVRAKSGTTFVRPKAGLKNSFTYMKTLFNDVTKGTGTTVISAAGGYEFALESDDWNNGVFTYATLQGLSTGKADLDGDGFVRVSELKNYVTLQVVELTNGKQHPTTRSENAVNDYILYKVKK